MVFFLSRTLLNIICSHILTKNKEKNDILKIEFFKAKMFFFFLSRTLLNIISSHILTKNKEKNDIF